MKLLIVEDEKNTATFLHRGLSEEGFIVDIAPTIPRAKEALYLSHYDLILLDVMLPGEGQDRDAGFHLCREWRAQGVTIPILFLTARDEVRDRVHGLNLGGDDYLVKPFAFEELLSRIRALLRRNLNTTNTYTPTVLTVGDITIDTERHCVTRAGEVVPLTAREYQILEYLARQGGKVVSRTVLWENIWETGLEPDSNVVDVYIRYLRNKLGREREYIETLRGVGYRLGDGSPIAGKTS